MADRTVNRGYPYPECDPPLVKDRSDIIDLKELAEAVNADAVAMNLRIIDFLEKPDSARINFNGNLVSSGAVDGQTFIVPYNAVTYDNMGNLTALGSNALIIRERGWYLFTSTLRCTNGAVGTEQPFLIRHLRNGLGSEEGRRFEGTAELVTAAGDSSMCTTDVMLCQVGDLITTQVRLYGTVGTFAWEGRLAMVQALKLDV